MFQHSKAHPRTPLLSLLINPAVQKSTPRPTSSPLFSSANSLRSSSFVFHYECPGNHQPQVWQKCTKRTGDEPRTRVDGGVGGCVCLFFKCVCVLRFDQRWQTLLSLMRFPLLVSASPWASVSIHYVHFYWSALLDCFKSILFYFIDFYSKSSLRKS